MIICKKIRDIAVVLSGVYFNEIPMGEVNYLQILSDVDLLFAAKGLFNFCALYSGDMGKSVASSSFWRLKLIDKKLIEITKVKK
jgi:hypothetical protein